MAKKLQKNKLSEDTKKSMATRSITAAVLVVLAVPAIIFGRWWFLIFCCGQFQSLQAKALSLFGF